MRYTPTRVSSPTTASRPTSSAAGATRTRVTPPARYAPNGSTGATPQRHVSFPRLVTSGSSTGRTVSTSRLAGSYATGSPYVRSLSGPSISRLNPDHNRGSTSRGPSSRTRAETVTPAGRVPSSRTVDRQAILERYGNRLPRSTGADGRTSRGSETTGPSSLRGSTSRSAAADRTARTTGTTRSATGDRTAAGGASRTSRTSRSSQDRGAGREGAADGTSRRADRDARVRNSGDAAQRRAVDGTRNLRDLASVNPKYADEIAHVGRRAADATRTAISVGIGVSLGYYSGYCSSWGWWGNSYYYGSCWGYYWACGGYSYSAYCHPWSWPYYWCYGSFPYYISSWYPTYYEPYYTAPVYYASSIATYVSEPYYEDPVQETAYVEELPVGEAVAQTSVPQQAATADANVRASGQYLTLGDQAFRDGRYADAVHFYARAVEYAPDEGILYLVLSDGLFATGDYHYGAYALRRAFELDPTLAESQVDKHTFYTDPIEFDQQLAVLEGFVADHPNDADALLMLAANYLFGGRPAAAVDLLEGSTASSVIGREAGALLLSAARAVQYGK